MMSLPRACAAADDVGTTSTEPGDATSPLEPPLTGTWVQTLLGHSEDLITLLDADGAVRYQSPNLERLLGFLPGELYGLPALDLVHPEDKPDVERLMDALLADPDRAVSAQFRVQHRDGAWRWVEATARNLLADGQVSGIFVNTRDVTERAAAARELRHQAFHDPLTGLPNRALFTDRLAQALRRAQRHGEHVAVLFIDLDHFKQINDTMGHETGDQVLVAVGQRLAACLPEGDTIARFGGEEFTVLLERTTSVAAVDLARQMLAAQRAPVALPRHDVTVSVSIGVAVSGPELENAEDLLRAADIAHYKAKADGRATVVLLEQPMYSQAMARLAMKFELQPAIEHEQLHLVYQPVIDLDDGRIVGMEALVRWHRPGAGVISPDDFLPLAEETGLIQAMGEWVLKEACRQARKWADMRPDATPLRMHVNVSERQLQRPDFVDQVRAALVESGLPAQLLTLEVREQALQARGDGIPSALRALRAMGVPIAVDDFGGRHSSFSALRHDAITLVNLDRATVQRLPTEATERAIVRSIAGLARTLDLDVVAEGIETGPQMQQARAAGCRFGQGFYFAPPLTAASVAELLAGTRTLDQIVDADDAVGDDA